MQPNAPASRAPRSTTAPKRRPGRPPTYVFDKPSLSENERRLRSAVLKRRERQNRSYRRKKLAKEALAARQKAAEHLAHPFVADGAYPRPAAGDLPVMQHPLGHMQMPMQMPGPPQVQMVQPLGACRKYSVQGPSLHYVPAPASSSLQQASLAPFADQSKAALPRLGDFIRDRPEMSSVQHRRPDLSRTLPDLSLPTQVCTSAQQPLSSPTNFNPISSNLNPISAGSLAMPSPALSLALAQSPSSCFSLAGVQSPPILSGGVSAYPVYPNDIQHSEGANVRSGQYRDARDGVEAAGSRLAHLPSAYSATGVAQRDPRFVQ